MAEVLLQRLSSNSSCHLYRDVFLQITQNIVTPQFCNHENNDISSAWVSHSDWLSFGYCIVDDYSNCIVESRQTVVFSL